MCPVGQGDLENIRSMQKHHFDTSIIAKEELQGNKSFRLDIHTSGNSKEMKEQRRRFLTVDEEIAEAFLDMSKPRAAMRKSPRMKDMKEESSYAPSDDDAMSIEEVTRGPSSSAAVAAASSVFMDSKVILDLTSVKNRAWLQIVGLLDYAMLPWEDWKCNAQAMHQFKFLQNNDGFVRPNLFLSVELVSYIFSLPIEGETKFDKAPVKGQKKGS